MSLSLSLSLSLIKGLNQCMTGRRKREPVPEHEQ